MNTWIVCIWCTALVIVVQAIAVFFLRLKQHIKHAMKCSNRKSCTFTRWQLFRSGHGECAYVIQVQYLHRTDNWTVALIGISGWRALCFAWHEYSTKSSSGVGDSWRRDVVVNRLFDSITLSSRRSVKWKMKSKKEQKNRLDLVLSFELIVT